MMDFMLFIISHGNPDNCTTYNALRESGYTGGIIIVVDNLDDVEAYKAKFQNVCVFDKMVQVQNTDTCMSHKDTKLSSAVYARNAVEVIGSLYQTFAVFDDDIVGFRIRYPKGSKLGTYRVQNMDKILSSYSEYIIKSNIACVSFANDGSFIGGLETITSGKLLEKRACFTVFIRNAHFPIEWSSITNEDYITSLLYANYGYVMFTLPFVQRTITGMNNRTDGSHEVYANTTSFERAMYGTLCRPDVCVPSIYKGKFVMRVNKLCAYPKIISQQYKKED